MPAIAVFLNLLFAAVALADPSYVPALCDSFLVLAPCGEGEEAAEDVASGVILARPAEVCELNSARPDRPESDPNPPRPEPIELLHVPYSLPRL
jgi:hypothetical protein